MTPNLRTGDLVEFGPSERPLSGEVFAVSENAITVVVDDFMGRRVPFTVEVDTVRRVLVGLVRRGGVS